MTLSVSELAFLAQHGFTEADVLDVRGKSSQQWKAEIRVQKKAFALGTPCTASGHRLRTRAGHCAQCDPSKIAYQGRYHQPGYVYIAGSLRSRVVKIGTAVDCEQRERNLNAQQYGAITDWRMLFHIKVDNAGEIEQNALRLLRRFKSVRRFNKDGAFVDAGEILSCSFSNALKAVSDAIGSAPRSDAWMSLDNKRYEFG
jgi:hypothetical protein